MPIDECSSVKLRLTICGCRMLTRNSTLENRNLAITIRHSALARKPMQLVSRNLRLFSPGGVTRISGPIPATVLYPGFFPSLRPGAHSGLRHAVPPGLIQWLNTLAVPDAVGDRKARMLPTTRNTTTITASLTTTTNTTTITSIKKASPLQECLFERPKLR